MGPSICDYYIQRIWHNHSIIAEINSTFLVLIPKVDHPEEVKDLRPIGLCNVILKLITKIMANRLKPLMQSIISPTQCSFVPGRHSSDNIIIAQEAMHSMRLKKGNKGMMAIKIDMEKTYDRLNWNFLILCLQDLNIPRNIIDIISNCVTTPSMQILWN